MIKSKALEANLASTYVDVTIDARYECIQAVMSRYYGLMEGVNTFLGELSHPYRNWQFIVGEARTYALDYFHLFQAHERGVEATAAMVDIFLEVIDADVDDGVRVEAVDNLLRYLQEIIGNARERLADFIPVLEKAFRRIHDCPDEHFFLFVKSFYPLKRIVQQFGERGSGIIDDYQGLNRLMTRAFRATYDFWLSLKDPWESFQTAAGDLPEPDRVKACFGTISHAVLNDLKNRLQEIENQPGADAQSVFEQLLALTDFGTIVERYRKMPQILLESGNNKSQGNSWKVIFLFHIMGISGLNLVHEEVLRDINRTVGWLIENESYRNVGELIEKTFNILKTQTVQFPATTLTCALNMGQAVYQTDEIDLVNFFIDQMVDLGFQTPMLGGVGNDWQIQVNTAHLQNIRTWLELIECKPIWSSRLLSCLIIEIALAGIFIKDTDLFPMDITRFLNSRIGPVFNLAKQLTRLFPAYFNDIGAEGQLRDISTHLDEITHRRDILIHFLRKQSHVESSNRIIRFMEAVLHFWQTRDKAPLQPFVPPDIYEQIDVSGRYIDGVNRLITGLEKKGLELPAELLETDDGRIRAMLADVSGKDPIDTERVALIAAFYKLLYHKYQLDYKSLRHHMDQLDRESFPDLDHLQAALDEPDLKTRLFMLMEYLQHLKEVIVSEESFEIRADIYKKRHITIDIPSMYGSYHERKFDALGLTFRIESLVNVLFEELVDQINLGLITRATFHDIYDRLTLFDKALRLDGIYSVELERQLDLLAHALEVRGFTFTQYLDIFKGFAVAVKNIINDYFNNIHGQNLTRILAQMPIDRIMGKYLPRESGVDAEKLKHRISEIFFRDRIATSLGLQQLDLFLTRILNTLFHQSSMLPKDKLHLLLNFDPQRIITGLDQVNDNAVGIIYMGNKGLNLLKLKNLGLPVPPGFIVTTEAFRCRGLIDGFAPVNKNFRQQVRRHITHMQKITGKRFGDPTNPLIFSVRSGASISQPGMMETFLDVGINEKIATGLAHKMDNPWFAWDNYRRFLQCYGMAFGLERDDFDAIIAEFKAKLGIPLKKGFTGQQMKMVALAYKKRIQDDGVEIPEDPLDQLFMTINAVFASWESHRAQTYRKIMGISDDWGTAVTVQEMVFGNISHQAGSGVFFTHNPRWSGDTLSPWGDFTLENQGEDVVAGLVRTLPISVKQQEIEMRDTDITLETHYPAIYAAIRKWAATLIYKKGWSPQEMEFTFDGPSADNLYLLQTRDMAIRERKAVLAFDINSDPENYLGHGIGVAGGAMSGRAVFSLEEIDYWREAETGSALILIRGDTVPDDIKEIHAADGLLTARGGLTSHASVVAHRLGKTCVVGCGSLECSEKEKIARFNQVVIRSGDHISIDGREGSVYQGIMKIREA
ncbi:phosphoenolpyruvate synthase/pyruvate phosphate dikinase [Desulfosarcina ovata subsp. sediminis]|uniref:Phosphoenolpyruvate synthase/pyruvate phosphate dikinase n=1 Tax=Desulfosarcina ovata subsp. sediminis TaxID=885957 RepID=A0A5K7ZYU9_9BACT|nr:PEP/pyruvate-binding domain-containing protein [Desulfosarcina ovata]BBO85270.1 phosphoenolpyruvate synthase/pyruvate phosphate dikinase [Desulfosarcina ovata subsp. sediminis]